MGMSSDVGRSSTQWMTGWRAATAIRVFILALAVGQAAGAGVGTRLSVLMVALAVIAAAASTAEFAALSTQPRLIPAAEGLLAAALLGTAEAPVGPLLVYLAVPPLVAGVRSGYLATVNAGLAIAFGLVGAWTATNQWSQSRDLAISAWPWLVIGVGAGLLAAWQTRSRRHLEDMQGPYLQANNLLTQLTAVTPQLRGGLESKSVAKLIALEVAEELESPSVAVYALQGEGLLRLADNNGTIGPEHARVAEAALRRRQAPTPDDIGLLPLRVGDRRVAVITHTQARKRVELPAERVVGYGLQLNSALLFDRIRATATAEERHRLARDIHDGVAQDVASLGYVIDGIADDVAEPDVHEQILLLRREVSRIVDELRHSIFDLRQDVGDGQTLTGAIEDYLAGVEAKSGFEAHPVIHAEHPLAPETETELLRIVQEAVTNVRKHAHATNVWVTLDVEDHRFRLVIEDDGRGGAEIREGHYGMHSMQERAASVAARLWVTDRPQGGTVVTVASSSDPATTAVQPRPRMEES